MTPDQLLDALPRSVLTILAVGTVLYTLSRMLAETSERFAKILGPLGSKWAKSRDRRMKRMEITDTLEVDLRAHMAAAQDLKAEVAYMRKLYNDNTVVEDLHRQTATLYATVVRLRDRESICDAYLVYDHTWHLNHSLGHNGVPHVEFLEFERQRRNIPDAPPMPTVDDPV